MSAPGESPSNDRAGPGPSAAHVEHRSERKSPIVGYVEHCLPGADVVERIELARAHGLALEVAYREPGSLDRFVDCGVPIATVQAYGMHELHPLSRDAAQHDLALEHVRAAIEQAARLRSPRVITVCGYGRDVCAHPFESCAAFFRALVPDARKHGVRVLIEPLSAERAGAMTHAEDIERLLGELAAPDVFGTALDTGHILDDGHHVEPHLERWRPAVDELQLRGANSMPPDFGFPLRRWLAALRAPPASVVVEHRAPIESGAFERLIERIRSEIAAV